MVVTAYPSTSYNENISNYQYLQDNCIETIKKISQESDIFSSDDQMTGLEYSPSSGDTSAGKLFLSAINDFFSNYKVHISDNPKTSENSEEKTSIEIDYNFFDKKTPMKFPEISSFEELKALKKDVIEFSSIQYDEEI